jgi:hypothetical protein
MYLIWKFKNISWQQCTSYFISLLLPVDLLYTDIECCAIVLYPSQRQSCWLVRNDGITNSKIMEFKKELSRETSYAIIHILAKYIRKVSNKKSLRITLKHIFTTFTRLSCKAWLMESKKTCITQTPMSKMFVANLLEEVCKQCISHWWMQVFYWEEAKGMINDTRVAFSLNLSVALFYLSTTFDQG